MKPYFLITLAVAVLLTGCGALPQASDSEKSVTARSNPGGEFGWPHGIRPGQRLTVENCVALALWNQPEYQAALADLGVARGEIVRAGQIANPSLAMFFPSQEKALELTARLPLELLWLRPKRLLVAGVDLEITEQRLTQAGADVARDVRVAVARVLMVEEQAKWARQSAELFAGMERIAETRQKAGDTSELELVQSRADAAVATQEHQRLAHEQGIATERLRSLLGMALQGVELRVGGTGKTLADTPASLSSGVKEALASRADVRAAELAVTAAGHRAGLAKAEIFSLTASAKFTDGAGLQPGFELPLPIFHQNQAARLAADAQLTKAMRQLAAARHKAAGETREALSRLQQARTVASGWSTALAELEQALEKSRKAVAEGDAQPILALDAARRLAEARSKAAESRFRQAEAAAELHRALGKT